MFVFNPATSAVTLHRGDTGAYWVNCSRKSGRAFSEGDVALYTVMGGSNIVMARKYDLGANNGRFLVAFRNSDTDTWAAGTYNTELRVIINPIESGGEPRDGDTVRTIQASKSTITVLDVLREV